MSENSHIQPIASKDRSVSLALFGMVHLCIGCFAALESVLLLFLVFIRTDPSGALIRGDDVSGRMVMAFGLCITVSAWFITLGIGSVLARSWARALILITSWIWLSLGLIWSMLVLLFMGDWFQQALNTSPKFSSMAQVIRVSLIAVSVLFFILLPGAFALYYGDKSVKLTCEVRNPRKSWTDACPLPVLAQAIILIVLVLPNVFIDGALSVQNYWKIPSTGFGTLIAIPVCGSLGLALAFGLYKTKPIAWWMSIVLSILRVLLLVLNFSFVRPTSASGAGIQSNRYEGWINISSDIASSHPTALCCVLAFWLGVFGLVLYNRRYFVTVR